MYEKGRAVPQDKFCNTVLSCYYIATYARDTDSMPMEQPYSMPKYKEQQK